MKVEHYYKPDSKTLREEPQVFTRWIDPTIEQLQQENKQIKEEIEEQKKYNIELMLCNSGFNAILTELEEWLREKINYIVNYIDKSKVKPYGEELRMLENCANRYNDVLNKIQELKEKYK